jgi:hypothetical protein
MGWFVGLLAGGLVVASTWALSLDVPPGARHDGSWRAGAPPDRGAAPPVPMLRPTRAPGSDAGQDGDEREIRPPVQRGPDDFYRKPPRERKPRDRMFA